MDTPETPPPPQPPPPDKNSESYKKLRASLKRSADKHFEQPQAAPPSVKEAQEADPSLKQATPPKFSEEAATPKTPVATLAKPKKQKRLWIKHPALRAVVAIFLLGVTGYCLWYIYQFKLKGDDGHIWWPWEKQPEAVKYERPAPATTTTTAKPAQTQDASKPTVSEEDKLKVEAEKKAQAEAAAKAAATAAAEKKKKQDEEAAKAKLEADEQQAIAVLEASLKGYIVRFQFEQAIQQMAQVGGTLTTEKAQARWQQLWGSFQPMLAFKQTLVGNVAAITYNGKPITNKQGGATPGNPVKADEEKIYFSSSYGPIGMAWETMAPDQVASLAAFYLHEREKQGSSKAYAQDYYNLMIYCLSMKLSKQAADYGTEAIQIDPTLRPKVKAVLGNAIP